MNIATKSYTNMWHHIELDFYELSSDKYNEDIPEIRLFAAIVVEAAKDRDASYFKDKEFINHARLLRISTYFIKKVIKKCWDVEDSGVVWSLTPQIEEDD